MGIENIRSLIIKKRLNLNREEVFKKSTAICEKIFDLIYLKNSKEVMAYFPIKNEVNTELLLKKIIKDKKGVILPKVYNKEIIALKTTNINNLSKGIYSILEPEIKKSLKIDIRCIDLVIVPGVVFGRNKERMGWGKGYYDNFLMSLKEKNDKAKIIGLSYELQLSDEIILRPHDVKMDMVITEKQIYM